MQQSELKEFYSKIYSILKSKDELERENNTIFKKNEKSCIWLTENHTKTIPLYFNFLNSKNIEQYHDFIETFTDFCLKKRKYKLIITQNEAEVATSSQHDKINYSKVDKILPDSGALECMSHLIPNINYDDFKSDIVTSKLLIKSYCRFLYAFGLVIDNLNTGIIKKITQNCYTFFHGKKIIQKNPEVTATWFTIVLLCLFLHGFEKHAAELFKFLCNESTSLDEKFIGYWTKTHTVHIMSKLILFSNKKNILELENTNLTIFSNAERSIQTKVPNNMSVSQPDIDLSNNIDNTLENRNCEVDSKENIFFDESYFKFQKNRSFNSDELCPSLLCKCGIKMIPIVQKNYIEYTQHYRKNSSSKQKTARANYLHFLCKQQKCVKRKFEKIQNEQVFENKRSKIDLNTPSNRYMKKLRYTDKGQLNRNLPLYSPPIKILACIFWNCKQTCCTDLKIYRFETDIIENNNNK